MQGMCRIDRAGGPILWLLALAFALCAFTGYAAELVTLQNGMEMRCAHHAEVNGRTRIFLSADDNSYIDLSPAEIFEIKAAENPVAPSSPATANASEPRKDDALTPVDLRQMLGRAGEQHNLDVDLLASIVKAESNGNPHAVSRAGARGLMQLMPATASELGVSDSLQAEQNVRGGSAYMDALLSRYNDNLALALAAYNAGPAAVDRYHGIPPFRETRAYVARVIHEFNRRVMERERLTASRPKSPEASR